MSGAEIQSAQASVTRTLLPADLQSSAQIEYVQVSVTRDLAALGLQSGAEIESVAAAAQAKTLVVRDIESGAYVQETRAALRGQLVVLPIKSGAQIESVSASVKILYDGTHVSHTSTTATGNVKCSVNQGVLYAACRLRTEYGGGGVYTEGDEIDIATGAGADWYTSVPATVGHHSFTATGLNPAHPGGYWWGWVVNLNGDPDA